MNICNHYSHFKFILNIFLEVFLLKLKLSFHNIPIAFGNILEGKILKKNFNFEKLKIFLKF